MRSKAFAIRNLKAHGSTDPVGGGVLTGPLPGGLRAARPTVGPMENLYSFSRTHRDDEPRRSAKICFGAIRQSTHAPGRRPALRLMESPHSFFRTRGEHERTPHRRSGGWQTAADIGRSLPKAATRF